MNVLEVPGLQRVVVGFHIYRNPGGKVGFDGSEVKLYSKSVSVTFELGPEQGSFNPYFALSPFSMHIQKTYHFFLVARLLMV